MSELTPPVKVDRFYSVREVAEAAGVSVQTVKNLDDQVGVEGVERTSGGHRRFSKKALDFVVEHFRQKAKLKEGSAEA